jgi:hypothetical protein
MLGTSSDCPKGFWQLSFRPAIIGSPEAEPALVPR